MTLFLRMRGIDDGSFKCIDLSRVSQDERNGTRVQSLVLISAAQRRRTDRRQVYSIRCANASPYKTLRTDDAAP